MMKPVVISLPICAVALSGCVMSQQGPFGPTETTVGPVPSDVTVSLDEATDTVTLRMGSEERVVLRTPASDVQGFRGYFAGPTMRSYAQTFALVGETSSGAGQVTIVSDEFFNVAGTFLDRAGETEVPTRGQATYSGNYVAYVSALSDAAPGSAGTHNMIATITGDAELEMDFADATVSGAITNRYSPKFIDVFDEITLEEGEIVDGAFSGVASGGSRDATDWTTTAGEYSGLLTGPNGEEVIGGVSIGHTDSYLGTEFIEIGGFVAE